MSANNLLLTHPTNLLSNTVLKDLIGCWHADECACPAGLNVLIGGVAQFAQLDLLISRFFLQNSTGGKFAI